MIDRPVVLLGGGGHASVLIDLLRCLGAQIAGVSLECDIPADQDKSIKGLQRYSDEKLADVFKTESILLANGIGTVTVSARRRNVFERFKAKGFQFATLIHPSAVIAPGIVLGEGVQIMAGVVVQAGCTIGRNCLLNTSSTLDHGSCLADHVHVASGAVVCGGVVIGENSHIGAGATIIQGIQLGANCLVAAGAVVIRDISEGATVMGVPARKVKK